MISTMAESNGRRHFGDSVNQRRNAELGIGSVPYGVSGQTRYTHDSRSLAEAELSMRYLAAGVVIGFGFWNIQCERLAHGLECDDARLLETEAQ